MKYLIPRPVSKFLKVSCVKCKNEQVIFNKPVRAVKCLVCDNVLAENTGGKAHIKTKIVHVMD